MGKRRKKFQKSERKWELENFCRIEKNLRLRHRMKFSWNNFEDLELDLEIFVQEEQTKE